MAEVIVALDFDSKEKALNLVESLGDAISLYKVGLELFSREGLGVVEELAQRGKRVFLDLKYHDIPNTVKSAARAAIEAGVFMYNLHALGGFSLMKEVAEFNAEYSAKVGLKERPIVLAVTLLTSLDEREIYQLGISSPLEAEVLRLAELAKRAGLDGVVCSPKEVPLIKRHLGEDFITVTPGIRPAWAERNDQKRATTPAEALRLGSDFMVVGRPITASPQPKEAALKILKELSEEN
jgi:orotidine-5'-phosphate decarboxylase